MGASEWTFRELDEARGLPKGSAFRAFKRVHEELCEGRDFRVLQANQDAGEIGDLRREGRIYAGSVNVVVLSPGATERVAHALDHDHA